MEKFSLDAAGLIVDSFTVTPTTAVVGGMKTMEPGCTTPELCPTNVAIAGPVGGMKTMEPGCTTPELCPTPAAAAPEPVAAR